MSYSRFPTAKRNLATPGVTLRFLYLAPRFRRVPWPPPRPTRCGVITTKKGIAMKNLLRNGILTGSLVTGLLLTGGALAPGAFAAGTSTPDGGGNSTQSNNNKPLKIEHPGGGTWDWGVLLGNNWSYYLHGSQEHGSSVGGDNGLVRSKWVAPGQWSKANAPDTNLFRIDGAYWRVR
nr:lactococcin 972 family bacteriocin [Mycetocola sp. JXN-3]